jgi:SMC interacting uncharacterized protein involved in chromosome segregation
MESNNEETKDASDVFQNALDLIKKISKELVNQIQKFEKEVEEKDLKIASLEEELSALKSAL